VVVWEVVQYWNKILAIIYASSEVRSLRVDLDLVDPLPVGRDPLEPVTFKYTIGPSPLPQEVQGALLAGILNPDSYLLH